MNFACMYAYLSEDPREVFTSANSTAMRCSVMLPPVGNKAPTQLDLNIYGKNAERFSRLRKGNYIYVHGAKLRFDLESRTSWAATLNTDRADLCAYYISNTKKADYYR